MSILMLCGSPRPVGSSSLCLLKNLETKLEQKTVIFETAKDSKEVVLARLESVFADVEAIVLAFPLYVDGIPAHLLGVLKGIEAWKNKKNTKVYVIINNGFYDAIQNRIAIDMMWVWCEKCGFEKGGAVAAGGGGMLQTTPIGQGPTTALGKAMDAFALAISRQETIDTQYVEPNFPRVLYHIAAHFSWKQSARKNGLKVSDLRRKD